MNDNDVLIYEDKDGITKVNVKFIDEELEENSTHKDFLLVQKE